MILWVSVILFAALVAAFIGGINYAKTEHYEKLMGRTVWTCPEAKCGFYISSTWFATIKEIKELHKNVVHD